MASAAPASAVPVALFGAAGAPSQLARQIADRLAADPRWTLLGELAEDRLQAALDAGARILDLRPGAPSPLPGSKVLPECALVEVARQRLFGARHLALPDAATAAALIACQPLLVQGLFVPDHVVLLVGGEAPGRVAELSGAAVEAIAVWLQALKLLPQPRLVASVMTAPIGSAVLAIVSGLVATADAGDPRVIRAALLAQPDEPGRRVCSPGRLPDLASIAGSAVAEVAAATDMLAERATTACALDGPSFLAAAAVRALEAAIEAPPKPASVPGRL